MRERKRGFQGSTDEITLTWNFWQKIVLSSDSISSTHRFLQISRVRLTRRVRVTRNSRRPEQGNALIRKKKRSAESREQSASWTLTIVDKILLSWSEIVGIGWSIDPRSRSSAISSILDANDRIVERFHLEWLCDSLRPVKTSPRSSIYIRCPKESERFLERSELKKKKKKTYSFHNDGSRENFRQSLFRIPEYSRSWEWLNIRAHWLLFRSSLRIIEVLPRTTSRLWSRTVLLRLRWPSSKENIESRANI